MIFLIGACPKCAGTMYDDGDWACLNCGMRIDRETMLDLRELEKSIEGLTQRQELYKVLKRSLSKKGYWKNLPRGNPKKGFAKSRLAGVNSRRDYGTD